MILEEVRDTIVRPALGLCANRLGIPQNKTAEGLLYTIGLQESRFEHRRQLGNGPARGFWQFEKGGGVRGVLWHAASRDRMKTLCSLRGVEPAVEDVWRSLETDDIFAACVARLLLWTDPYALPRDREGAWRLYAERLWRPGKPHPQTWPGFYNQGVLLAASEP